jgi:hypothetical protein
MYRGVKSQTINSFGNCLLPHYTSWDVALNCSIMLTFSCYVYDLAILNVSVQITLRFIACVSWDPDDTLGRCDDTRFINSQRSPECCWSVPSHVWYGYTTPATRYQLQHWCTLRLSVYELVFYETSVIKSIMRIEISTLVGLHTELNVAVSYLRGPTFGTEPRDWLSWFFSHPQGKCRDNTTYLKIRPRSLPSTSFQIHYSPIIISFHAVQDECSMPSNLLCVPHNLLKSLVPVFFQALGMEIQRYRNVCCALTD